MIAVNAREHGAIHHVDQRQFDLVEKIDEDLAVVPFLGQPDFGETGGDQELDDAASSVSGIGAVAPLAAGKVQFPSAERTICMRHAAEQGIWRFAAFDEIAVAEERPTVAPNLTSKALSAPRA